MNDNRLVNLGWEIPTERYSDQPYVVKTDDGAWLCVMTTGAGHEGQQGQHVVTTRSIDRGRTWSPLVDVEPADGPEASYAVLLKVPGGRVYCFYNHNTDNRRYVIADDPPYKDGKCYRVDSQGYFVYKYSDDHGKTWSAQRYTIPIREMAIDRENVYGGEVQFFWNVGRPFIHDDAAYISLHKVGGFGHGFFTRSEGVLLKSVSILSENNPDNITFETLPDGDAGLRTPPGGGPIAEEQSYSVLSDGSFYCVYRTTDGYPAFAYSRDGGHTWTEPQYKRYASGMLMKHPRAANFAWNCENGNFLYWYHNHGGNWYEDRNPVWVCGGVEVDSPDGKVIQWSQPEIALYDDDTYIRMSYPDLVEDDGDYYLLETQKDKARVHLVDKTLLEGMWAQFDENGTVTKDGCILDYAPPQIGDSKPESQLSELRNLLSARRELEKPTSLAELELLFNAVIGDAEEVLSTALRDNLFREFTMQQLYHTSMPPLSPFTARDRDRPDYGTKDLRNGFTAEAWLQLDNLEAGQVLLDTRAENGQGWCLQITPHETVEIVLNDGRTESRWDCDPGVITTGKLHHLAVIVDGGPKLIIFVVDGVLCDGGDHRQFGWGRFNPNLRHVNNTSKNRVIAPGNQGGEEIIPSSDDSDTQHVIISPLVRHVRVYDRALHTSEVIGNYKAGM